MQGLIDRAPAGFISFADDGTIRDVSGGGRGTFGTPTRIAYTPRGGWLYVADSSNDRVVVLNMPKIAPDLVRARAVPQPAPVPRTRG